MPKKPTEKLEGIRIEFNEKERQILQGAVTAYQVKSILPSVATILTDVSALYALGIIYEIVTGRDIPFIISSLEDLNDPIQAAYRGIKEEYEARKADYVTGGGLERDLDAAQKLAGNPLNPFNFFNFIEELVT